MTDFPNFFMEKLHNISTVDDLLYMCEITGILVTPEFTAPETRTLNLIPTNILQKGEQINKL